LKLPIILNNGGFIYDPVSNKNLVSNYMQNDISKNLIDEIVTLNFNPFVHLEVNNQNKLYYSALFNYGERDYYDSRMKANDKRFEKVKKYNIENKKVITIFLIGEKNELTDLYEMLKEKYPVVQYHLFLDVYSHYYWLEINSINATKKNGVKFLKKHLNIENVTCFGDHLNDLSMFEECDNSYAVKNAHKNLIELADEVIGSNIEDGVAKFLESRMIL
ncbi:MAG: HAD hydrolase family protein, partial [Bacillota bacterium]|nr:HAD hydrolase family protein [Bacillota bacterium]